MIPLNQLIPECLLALGAAFLLGNLAAYVRLRPAWREAKNRRSGQRGKPRTKGGNPSTGNGRGASTSKLPSTGSGPDSSTTKARERRPRAPKATAGQRTPDGAKAAAGERRSGGSRAAAGPRSGASGRVSARVREPTASRSLPSRTRVLVNVMIGFVVTVAALAALIRG